MGLFDIFKVEQFKKDIQNLTEENRKIQLECQAMHSRLAEFGIYEYDEIQNKIKTLKTEYANLETELAELKTNTEQQGEQLDKLIKSTKTQTNKVGKSKELVKAMDYSLTNYFNYDPSQSVFKITPEQLNTIDELSPSIILKLHCMDVKDLRKAYRDNDKLITQVLQKYASRYTTKANKAIYNLMVIALRAELQNILYNLKFEKLDTAIDDVKSVTQKYLKIAGEGNQSIVGTLTKFIGEIEYLFINAVKIEYNHYVKKEQIKQEQLALREQMKQEADERKALAAEQKKIEQEESKFTDAISKLKEQLVSATTEETSKMNARILELEAQLANVVVKKAEISKLANGKAGNVYVISNLGSFGENVFKIGMTRRLNPQDRVNELGDASVPFKFDVHSFIFSDDAVGLESKLHNIMNNNRLNKVNLRKEFFVTSIDELEDMVTSIEPTAEFNRTMLAEEYRQSLSTKEIYSSNAEIVEYADE